jgi:hypothetical protein
MTCRSRGERERGGAKHKDKPLQCLLWCSARRSPFSHTFAPESQFAGHSKAQAHCLALEGSLLDRPYAVESRCGAVV